MIDNEIKISETILQYMSTLGPRQAYNWKSPSRARLIRNVKRKKHYIHVIIYKRSSKSKKKNIKIINMTAYLASSTTDNQLTSNMETRIHTVMALFKRRQQ